MKKVKNPLPQLLTSQNVNQLQKMFGEKQADSIMTKDVYKYDHKGIGEGKGDQRNK